MYFITFLLLAQGLTITHSTVGVKRRCLGAHDINNVVNNIMESVFVEIDSSTERLEFQGSSSDDTTYAKKFWMCGYLPPCLESSLPTKDIMQRLPVAPTPGQGYQRRQKPEYNDKLESFFRKAQEAQRMEELQWLERLAYLREADRVRLSNQRQKREQMEERLTKKSKFRLIQSSGTVSKSASEAQQAMAEIAKFEQTVIRSC